MRMDHSVCDVRAPEVFFQELAARWTFIQFCNLFSGSQTKKHAKWPSKNCFLGDICFFENFGVQQTWQWKLAFSQSKINTHTMNVWVNVPYMDAMGYNLQLEDFLLPY